MKICKIYAWNYKYQMNASQIHVILSQYSFSICKKMQIMNRSTNRHCLRPIDTWSQNDVFSFTYRHQSLVTMSNEDVCDLAEDLFYLQINSLK